MGPRGPSTHLDEPRWHPRDAPDALTLFWVQNVAIVAWHKAITPAVLEDLRELIASRRAEFPGGMSFVHVGSAQFSIMDPESRDACVRVIRSLKDHIAVTAVVGKPGSFLASAARSVATSILALARLSRPIRFHERVLELLDWFPDEHEKLTRVSLDVDRFRRALQQAERL